MRRRRPPLLTSLAVLAGALTLVLSGCAKDEPVAAPPPATTGSTVASGVSDLTATTASTTAPSPEAAEFCGLFTQFGQKASSLTDSPEDFATAKSYFQQLTDAAPEAIKADMTALNQVLQAQTSPVSPPPALADAAQRIEAWSQQNCGS